MARKRPKAAKGGRASLHVVLDAETLRRLRTFAAFHGRDLSACVAEGIAMVTRGFSLPRQESPGGSEKSPGLTLVEGSDAA